MQVPAETLVIPEPIAASYSSMLMDAAGEKSAQVFQAPKTGTIDRIAFRTVAVTTPTDTDVRLESVDLTTGDPSGSLAGSGSNGTVLSGAITANTWIEVTLTTPKAVTKGDLLAVVIAPSGTPNFNVARMVPVNTVTFPYSLLYTTLWTKSTAQMNIAVRYDDGSYPKLLSAIPPASAQNNISLAATTTPDELGNLFRLPFRARVTGFYIDTSTAANATEMTIRLYDANNNVLLSKTIDYSVIQSSGVVHSLFDSTYVIEKNTDYRIAAEAITTGTNRAIRTYDAPSQAVMEGFSFGDPSNNYWKRTQRTNAGAWSEPNAFGRAGVGIIVDRTETPGERSFAYGG